jgi:hypothetical protein
MALLDLQGMDAAPQTGGGGHSNSSGHSCDASNVSVTICEGHSVLSLLLCHN